MMEYYDLAKVGVASSPPDKSFGGQGVSFLALFKEALRIIGVLFLFSGFRSFELQSW